MGKSYYQVMVWSTLTMYSVAWQFDKVLYFVDVNDDKIINFAWRVEIASMPN